MSFPKTFFPQRFLEVLSFTEYKKTGEVARILGCSNQTVTKELTALHKLKVVEMQEVSGGRDGTRQLIKLTDVIPEQPIETIKVKSGKEIGRVEEIYQTIKAKCKFVVNDGCTYRENKECSAKACPMIIRRNNV